MSEFLISDLSQSSVLVIYSDRLEIQLDPDYQRISDIWTLEKRQLLIDSIINGFDVPKLYFHEFVPFKQKGSSKYRYAIIDGKQRLQTIWDFIDGKINLADDFKYLRDNSVKAEGLTYTDLAANYPQIKSRFDGYSLPIMTIRTDDLDTIEDMFLRLNEAVPLNAPEKRSAFGGPIPSAIREVAKHLFFKRHVPFPDKRYRHRDMAAKFAFIEFSNKIVNTKKVDLDALVKKFKKWRAGNQRKASAAAVLQLRTKTEKTMTAMASAFKVRDPLLRQVGMITLYYYLFRFMKQNKVDRITRDMLMAFETARDANRILVEQTSEANTRVDSNLVAFDQHSQTPNDAYAIRDRLEIILKFFKKKFRAQYDRSVLQPPE